jgi:NADH dehydrogenase
LHARRDATYIRGRILPAFELAETEPDPDERRRRQLNFVVVGGGPTGVEMAGSIAELAKRALASDSGDDVVQTLIQHDRR